MFFPQLIVTYGKNHTGKYPNSYLNLESEVENRPSRMNSDKPVRLTAFHPSLASPAPLRWWISPPSPIPLNKKIQKKNGTNRQLYRFSRAIFVKSSEKKSAIFAQITNLYVIFTCNFAKSNEKTQILMNFVGI